MKCKLWFCEGKHYAKGYCKTHWANLRRYGTPIAPGNRDLRNAMVFAEELSKMVIGSIHHQDDSDDAQEMASQILVVRTKIDHDELMASAK